MCIMVIESWLWNLWFVIERSVDICVVYVHLLSDLWCVCWDALENVSFFMCSVGDVFKG